MLRVPMQSNSTRPIVGLIYPVIIRFCGRCRNLEFTITKEGRPLMKLVLFLVEKNWGDQISEDTICSSSL